MNQRFNMRHVQGFTLIELMLSMTFISIMLLAIAMCIMQMSTIYNRGETLRQVNQSSRVVVTDMQRTFAEAEPTSIVDESGKGRICTGYYSYIWWKKDGNYQNNVFTKDGTQIPAEEQPIRLIRLVDTNATYCTTKLNEPIPVTAAYTELLQNGERRLLVHDLQVTGRTKMELTGQTMYRFEMLLGTEDTAAIETTDGTCKPPSEESGDLEYCAVNKINFAVRAGIR